MVKTNKYIYLQDCTKIIQEENNYTIFRILVTIVVIQCFCDICDVFAEIYITSQNKNHIKKI